MRPTTRMQVTPMRATKSRFWGGFCGWELPFSANGRLLFAELVPSFELAAGQELGRRQTLFPLQLQFMNDDAPLAAGHLDAVAAGREHLARSSPAGGVLHAVHLEELVV